MTAITILGQSLASYCLSTVSPSRRVQAKPTLMATKSVVESTRQRAQAKVAEQERHEILFQQLKARFVKTDSSKEVRHDST